jgi:hypothetical protein
MNKANLNIIFEGESFSSKDWCDKLFITNSEFNELLLSKIFKQKDQFFFRNTFVGTIKLNKNLFYSLPKCFKFSRNHDENTVKQIVLLVEKSLLNYKKRVDNSKAIIAQGNFYLTYRFLESRTEFDLFLTLKENYFKYGLFRKIKDKYQTRKTFSRINWQQTISKSFPIYSNGAPIYISPFSKDYSYEESKITILHLSILSLLAKKYYFFESNNGNLSAKLKTEHLEYISENELRRDAANWINILNSELRRTYKDELKATLLLLLEFFSESGYKSNKSFSFFGTSYYHNVWEDALKVATLDQYDKFISQIGQPAYHLVDGSKGNFGQEPDILIERGKSFYILDAKYYILQRTKPGWKDIVKQLFYHKSFLPKKPYDNIVNAFLTPQLIELEKDNFDIEDKYLGNIIIELDGIKQPGFSEIKIFALNPITIFKNYIKPSTSGLKFKQLLPPF